MFDIKIDKLLIIKLDSKGKEKVNLKINILCFKFKINNFF